VKVLDTRLRMDLARHWGAKRALQMLFEFLLATKPMDAAVELLDRCQLRGQRRFARKLVLGLCNLAAKASKMRPELAAKYNLSALEGLPTSANADFILSFAKAGGQGRDLANNGLARMICLIRDSGILIQDLDPNSKAVQ